MGKAKGTTLVTAVRFLRSQRERAAQVLPPALHHYLHERVLESLWYPESDLLGVVSAVAELMPMERAEALVMVGRISVTADHTAGRYQHLHEGAGLSGLPMRVLALWKTQHDTGDMRLELGPGASGVLSLRGYADASREMCTLLIGYLGETLIANGIVDPQVKKRACVLGGAPQCEWAFSYDAKK